LAAAREDALAQGITPENFDSATAGIAPLPAIAGMNANQPEFTKPVWSYLDGAVSARRIADARFMLTRYGDVLDKIAAQSGVPKEILVSVWGMESDYGADSGSFNLFAALATLAYDGPRATYAKPEFLAALQIYQQQHYSIGEMVGSSPRPPFSNTPPTAMAMDGSICGGRRPTPWPQRRACYPSKVGHGDRVGDTRSCCRTVLLMKMPIWKTTSRFRNGARVA